MSYKDRRMKQGNMNQEKIKNKTCTKVRKKEKKTKKNSRSINQCIYLANRVANRKPATMNVQ